MKRYLVFTGHNYGALGGMDDFAGDFDDLVDAKRAGRLHWANILDTTTGLVSESHQPSEWTDWEAP